VSEQRGSPSAKYRNYYIFGRLTDIAAGASTALRNCADKILDDNNNDNDRRVDGALY